MTIVVIWKAKTTVRDIQLKDAKASLSRLVDGAPRGEEFAITRHGRKEAVVISWAAWERLSKVPSFGRLLASAPIEEDDIPGRRSDSEPRRRFVNYLLDTSVISAVAPTRKDRPAALVEWLDLSSSRLYLSVVTAAEVSDGIAKAAREGAVRKAANLKEWWDAVEHLYRDRILPFDLRAPGAS